MLLLPVLSVRAESTDGPLQFNVPPGWNVEYDDNAGAKTYKFTCHAEKIVFNFAYWKDIGNAEEISSLMRKTSSNFYESISRIAKATKGEFHGSSFSGWYVEYMIAPSITQSNFEFSDGAGMWEGNYAGSPDSWKKALEVLKGIKKKQ